MFTRWVTECGYFTLITYTQDNPEVPKSPDARLLWAFVVWGFNTNSWINKVKMQETRHVLVKHRCPRWQQNPNMAKISKSYILTLPHPQGHVMSVRWEEPIDELTIQVWLLYHHPHFKYCTLYVSGTELRTDRRTDRQMDGQTDDPITRCPRRTFQAVGIKIIKDWNSKT